MQSLLADPENNVADIHVFPQNVGGRCYYCPFREICEPDLSGVFDPRTLEVR